MSSNFTWRWEAKSKLRANIQNKFKTKIHFMGFVETHLSIIQMPGSLFYQAKMKDFQWS